MKLECYKSLWGATNRLLPAVDDAARDGFCGVEGPLPENHSLRIGFFEAIKSAKLKYIAEVATTGTYVPDRRISVEGHLDYLEKQLAVLAEVQPEFITCLGGCDAWPMDDSIRFFERAMELAGQYNLFICFETHRGRSLFNPWITQEIAKALPELTLTFDLSHWCVVCEGLQETEEQIIRSLACRVQHIHARVGYDQGPQVPQPFSGVYREDCQRHLRWWRWLWQSQQQRGYRASTVTPEFGPDGYEYRDPEGGSALVDLDAINRDMASLLRRSFETFSTSMDTAATPALS